MKKSRKKLNDFKDRFNQWLRKHLWLNKIIRSKALLSILLMFLFASLPVVPYRLYSKRKLNQYLDDLSTDNPIIQQNLLYKIGRLKDTGKLSNIYASLFSDDSVSRTEASRMIKKFLKSRLAGTRLKTVIALGRLETVEGTVPLLDLYQKEKSDKKIRLKTVESLGKIGDPRAVPLLLSLSNDKDLYTRISAIWALGKIGDKKAVPVLVNLLEDKDKFVSYQAAIALKKLK